MKVTGPRRQKGATLVLVALMMVVFIGMAALAIDLGVLYTARTSAQHAADAAALAGAYEFALPCWTTPSSCPGYDIQAAAKARARQMAVQNSILRDPVVLADSDIFVDEANERVTVTFTKTVPTFFAKIWDKTSANIGVTAIAEAGTAGTGNPTPTTSHCLKPVFLPNTILATGEDPDTACKASPPHVIFDASGKVTTWAGTQFNQAKEIRPADPKDALAPGQFYSLDFGNDVIGHGAEAYRCALGKCLNECGIDLRLTCNSPAVLDTETGNMVGPTTQGINTLIGTPPDVDSWIDQSPSMFQLAGGGTSPSSRSLAVAPVWDNCKETIGSGTTYTAHVIGFVQVFVDSVVQSGSTKGNVTAHIIGQFECGQVDDGGGTVPGPTAGPLTVPIRLVQPQPAVK